MKQKYPISIILILVSFCSIFGQTTIYSEDFTGQNGKGAVGPGSTIDASGVTWDVDVSAATLDNNDWFFVRNQFFEARDLDGPAIWLSPVIDITGFTNVQFSLDAFENRPGTADPNDLQFEPDDTYVTEYRIDGAAWTIAANNGSLNDDIPDTVVSTAGLAGNTIELRVTINNNGGGERYRIDNVLVEGTAPVIPIINVTPNTISGLTYVEGDLSLQEETFTVQGFSLTNDITITSPADFEISTVSGGPYNNTINLTPTAGEVTLTTIYVRLIEGLTANTYSGTITATSIGAAGQNISVDGEVTAPIPDCSELFFSEYHEGVGSGQPERYLEIYNPTNAIIDMTNYRIANHRNGGTIPITLDLTGTINPYSSYVIARDVSTLGVAGTADFISNSAVINFTGNDAVALQTIGGSNIDVIGIIGDNTNFARDRILRRNRDIQIPTISYNPAQWSTFFTVNDTSNLGIHDSECLCPDTATWDSGGWVGGITPNNTTAVIINDTYNTSGGGSFTACSLTINAGFSFTVANGDFVEVEKFVLVNDGARLTTQTQGSFVQRGDDALAGEFILVGSGTADVQKTTATLNTENDYTYWSSPIVNSTIANGLTNANTGRRYTFNANNFLDTFGDGIDDNGDVWEPVTDNDIMEPGKGYISMHGFFLPPLPNAYTYDFEGEYNTGDIIQTVPYNNANVINHWNLLGNPYPSAINTDLFFSTNSGVIDQVLYMWSQVSPPDGTNPGNEVLNFSQNDYITINTMSTSGNGTTPDPPFRQVPSGQSFFISSINAGDVLFTNSMRVSGTNVNSEFYRTTASRDNSAQESIERLWLNLSSDIGIYSQISVAYADIATNGDDGHAIDTPRNYAGTAGVLYSLDNDGVGFYVIQGKALSSLDTDETIKVGFGTFISTTETYTLSLVGAEGSFLASNPIYLRDNYTGTIHDLSTSYSFVSDPGIFEDRFEIVFNNSVLSVDNNSIDERMLSIVELADDNIKFNINGSSQTIKSVSVFDLQGRLVANFEGNSASEVYSLSTLSTSIFIAKVELSNGQVLTQKAYKK